MPAVTELCRLNGEPMASTQDPGRKSALPPSGAAGRGSSLSTLRMARSLAGSACWRCASNWRPSRIVTVMCAFPPAFAPATT